MLIRHVRIPTFDNQLPDILLAIRLRSMDLKHLILGNGPPEFKAWYALLSPYHLPSCSFSFPVESSVPQLHDK